MCLSSIFRAEGMDRGKAAADTCRKCRVMMELLRFAMLELVEGSVLGGGGCVVVKFDSFLSQNNFYLI